MSKELSLVSQTVRLQLRGAQSYPGESVLVWKSLSKPAALVGNAARAVQQCAVSKRPGSDTPGGVALAQIVVRAPTAKAKHETWPLWSPGESHTVTLSELIGCLAMPPGENGSLLVPVTVPRRLSGSYPLSNVRL